MAAHISGAAEGGPRYDPNLSPEERSAPSNGIWLCQNHAKLIDNDVTRFTIGRLKDWKHAAELDAQNTIGKTERERAAEQAKLAVAAKTTLVANRLELFIRNAGASWASRPRMNAAVRAALAMGAQLSHFPNDIIVEQYVSEFAKDMEALLPTLRNAGAEFRRHDSYCVHPSAVFFEHTLPSILAELRVAANTLAVSATV